MQEGPLATFEVAAMVAGNDMRGHDHVSLVRLRNEWAATMRPCLDSFSPPLSPGEFVDTLDETTCSAEPSLLRQHSAEEVNCATSGEVAATPFDVFGRLPPCFVPTSSCGDLVQAGLAARPTSPMTAAPMGQSSCIQPPAGVMGAPGSAYHSPCRPAIGQVSSFTSHQQPFLPVENQWMPAATILPCQTPFTSPCASSSTPAPFLVPAQDDAGDVYAASKRASLKRAPTSQLAAPNKKCHASSRLHHASSLNTPHALPGKDGALHPVDRACTQLMPGPVCFPSAPGVITGGQPLPGGAEERKATLLALSTQVQTMQQMTSQRMQQTERQLRQLQSLSGIMLSILRR